MCYIRNSNLLMRGKILIVLWITFLVDFAGIAQTINNVDPASGRTVEGVNINTITTAAPFLMISPDSRSSALGDAGVASSPDANSLHWNPSKLAFIEKDFGASVSFAPWLRALVPDISLSYLTFYKRIDKRSTFGGSLRYFSLGDMVFTDIQGREYAQFTPSEYAISGTYAMKLSDRFSGGIALRYINSNLTGGNFVGEEATKAGRSVSADLSVYYVNDDVEIGGRDAVFSFGTNISNIGAKIAYSESADKDFIPINLRLGQATKMALDEYNSITLLTDFNKLLVPTPAVRDESDPTIIIAGRDNNVGIASGIFGSFTDAPGNILYDDNGNAIYDGDKVAVEKGSRFKEEMREINYSLGTEYWYDDQFAIRMGYFHEHASKGNRKYFSIGVGLRLSTVGLDFSYLVGNVQRTPLANTIRFSIIFDIDKNSGKDS